MMVEILAQLRDGVAARRREAGRIRPLRDAVRSAPVAEPASDETDPLTGLCTRQGLVRRLEERLATARRSGEVGAVIFCDLEALGMIVERFGAAAGAAALRVAGEAIGGAVRGTDVVGRIEGGSFAVLLGRVAADQALAIAARVSTEVRSRRLEWDGQSLPVAVSVGIAAYTGAEDADALLARAARPAAGGL